VIFASPLLSFLLSAHSMDTFPKTFVLHNSSFLCKDQSLSCKIPYTLHIFSHSKLCILFFLFFFHISLFFSKNRFGSLLRPFFLLFHGMAAPLPWSNTSFYLMKKKQLSSSFFSREASTSNTFLVRIHSIHNN